MSETVSAESIGRRLDGLQNNVSGLNRRMIMLESNLIDRVGAVEARMAGLKIAPISLSIVSVPWRQA
jgi:hypothetical protein